MKLTEPLVIGEEIFDKAIVALVVLNNEDTALILSVIPAFTKDGAEILAPSEYHVTRVVGSQAQIPPGSQQTFAQVSALIEGLVVTLIAEKMETA